MNKLMKFKLLALFLVSIMASPLMARKIIIFIGTTQYELTANCVKNNGRSWDWDCADEVARLVALKKDPNASQISEEILQSIASQTVKASFSNDSSYTYYFRAASTVPSVFIPSAVSSSSSSAPATDRLGQVSAEGNEDERGLRRTSSAMNLHEKDKSEKKLERVPSVPLFSRFITTSRRDDHASSSSSAPQPPATFDFFDSNVDGEDHPDFTIVEEVSAPSSLHGEPAVNGTSSVLGKRKARSDDEGSEVSESLTETGDEDADTTIPRSSSRLSRRRTASVSERDDIGGGKKINRKPLDLKLSGHHGNVKVKPKIRISKKLQDAIDLKRTIEAVNFFSKQSKQTAHEISSVHSESSVRIEEDELPLPPPPSPSGAPQPPVPEFIDVLIPGKETTINHGRPWLRKLSLVAGVTSLLAMIAFAGRETVEIIKDLRSKDDDLEAEATTSDLEPTGDDEKLLSRKVMGFATAFVCGIASLCFYRNFAPFTKNKDVMTTVKVPNPDYVDPSELPPPPPPFFNPSSTLGDSLPALRSLVAGNPTVLPFLSQLLSAANASTASAPIAPSSVKEIDSDTAEKHRRIDRLFPSSVSRIIHVPIEEVSSDDELVPNPTGSVPPSDELVRLRQLAQLYALYQAQQQPSEQSSEPRRLLIAEGGHQEDLFGLLDQLFRGSIKLHLPPIVETTFSGRHHFPIKIGPNPRVTELTDDEMEKKD